MNKKLWIVGVVAIVAILGFWYFNSGNAPLGVVNVEDYVPVIMQEGYNSAKPITLSGASGDITSGDDITVGDDLTVTDDATVSGGSFTVTTTNTATSTTALGCVQTTATSTVTPIKIMFFASTTLNIDGASITSGFGGTQAGLVLWGFGNCP